jgi:hypothetical protein
MQPGDVVRHKSIPGKFLLLRVRQGYGGEAGIGWWVRTPEGEEKTFYEIEFYPKRVKKTTQKAG